MLALESDRGGKSTAGKYGLKRLCVLPKPIVPSPLHPVEHTHQPVSSSSTAQASLPSSAHAEAEVPWGQLQEKIPVWGPGSYLPHGGGNSDLLWSSLCQCL